VRIGINILFLIPGGVGGTEIYTRALLAALARNDDRNEYFIYRNRETGADVVPARGSFHDRPQPVAATSRPARIAYEQLVLPIVMQRDRIDAVLNCGITLPLLSPLPMVTVFYDVQYKRFGGQLRGPELLATRLLFPASAKRSARLITMTEAAARELIAYFPSARGKTLIVPHGIETAFREVASRRANHTRPERPFVLAVSSLMAHKNFEILLDGFARLRSVKHSLRLIIVGLLGSRSKGLESLRDRLGLRDAVTFTGWIPRADLLELFLSAEAFVFASRYEGFGIPVLEAMTAGVPVACSDIEVLHEVAGDGACYFDPDDPSSISDALALVLDDEDFRNRLIGRGLLRAKRFDWDLNVQPLIAAFERVTNRRTRRR